MINLGSILAKISYFLHITDGEGQLDIVDLAFIGIVIKMLYAPNFDWAAVCSLLPIIISQLHADHIASK